MGTDQEMGERINFCGRVNQPYIVDEENVVIWSGKDIHGRGSSMALSALADLNSVPIWSVLTHHAYVSQPVGLSPQLF